MLMEVNAYRIIERANYIRLILFLAVLSVPFFLLYYKKYKTVWALLIIFGVIFFAMHVFIYYDTCAGEEFRVFVSLLLPFFFATPSVLIYCLVLTVKKHRDKEYKNEKGYRFLRDYGRVWVILAVVLLWLHNRAETCGMAGSLSHAQIGDEI